MDDSAWREQISRGIEESISRAVDKARQTKTRAWWYAPGVYRVKSSDPSKGWYTVTVGRERLYCTCRAGEMGKVCYHAAKVALRLEREAKLASRRRVRVTSVTDYELFDGDGPERSPVRV